MCQGLGDIMIRKTADKQLLALQILSCRTSSLVLQGKQLIALLLLICSFMMSCSSSKVGVDTGTISENSTVSANNNSNQSATNTPPQTITPSPTSTPNPLSAKRSPECKISNIKIVPFDALTGGFGEEIKPNEDTGFFNAFGTSLFVMVEISSQAYFNGISISDANKDIKVEITVTDSNVGQRAKKIEGISLQLLLEDGKIFVPLWLDPLMCSEVKINARIIGQKTVSTMKRTVLFECGE